MEVAVIGDIGSQCGGSKWHQMSLHMEHRNSIEEIYMYFIHKVNISFNSLVIIISLFLLLYMKAMRKVCVCQLRNHVFYLYLSCRHIGIERECVSNNASVIYNGSQFKFQIRP